MKSPASLNAYFGRALGWIVGGSRTRWLVAGSLLCAVLPWFFSCPLFPANPESPVFWRQYWSGIEQRKIDHPLHDFTTEFPPASNETKRNFRILIPVAAKLMGLGPRGMDVIRYSLQFALILGLLLAAERACGDRVTALGAALAVAGTQIGTEVWRDVYCWFDNCAHAFVALALLARGPWLAFTVVLLGLWVDERVLCAVPLLALFHVVISSRRSVLAGLLLAGPVYFALRAGLTLGFGLHNALAGIGTAHELVPNLANAPMAFWFSLEGGWLLLLVAAREPGLNRQAIAALLVFTILLLCASGFVGDFTRSATYAFPAIFVALALLARAPGIQREPAQLRSLAGWAAGISLFVPNGIVLGEVVGFESSLPVRALQAWLRSL